MNIDLCKKSLINIHTQLAPLTMALSGGTLEVMIERSGMVTWIVLATIPSNSRSGPRSLILPTLPSSTLRKIAGSKQGLGVPLTTESSKSVMVHVKYT